MIEEARNYLQNALDILKQNSINRARLDWPAIQQSALDVAAEAQIRSDVYPAIRRALELLEDDHSFLKHLRKQLRSNQALRKMTFLLRGACLRVA